MTSRLDWLQASFGIDSTAKYVETKQASTTIPFGWDDADNMKVVKSIVVNSYNAVSCTLRSHIFR